MPLLLRLLLGAAAAARGAGGGPAGIQWFVDPMAVQVAHTRRAPFPSSARGVDMAESRGGCERQQLWLWSNEANLQGVQLSVSAGVPGTWAYKQQGYVRTLPSDLYLCTADVLSGWSGNASAEHQICASGWYPDVLLDIPVGGIPLIEKGVTQPIMLEVCINRTEAAGNFSGSLQVEGKIAGFEGSTTNFSFSVPLSLEVWPMIVPEVSDPASFSTTFSFGSTGTLWGLQHWYPGLTTAEIWSAWLPFLAKHRIPGDDLYTQPEPRPIEEMQALASSGAKHMNLLYGEAVPNTTDLIARLAPAIDNLTRLGLAEKAYLYGFDESPLTNATVSKIYERFGAVKERWPDLRTHATLNWPELRDDFQVDVWINEFGQWGSADHYRDATPKSVVKFTGLTQTLGQLSQPLIGILSQTAGST